MTHKRLTPLAPFSPEARSDRVPVDLLTGGVLEDRAHDDGVSIHDLGEHGGGRCEYGRLGRSGGYRVTALHVPSLADARGRLIRAHELLHAQHSPGRRRTDSAFPPEVTNTAEDTHIHTNGWPQHGALAHLTRDALAVALADVRSTNNAARAGQIKTDGDWNLAISVMIRSTAIIRGAYRASKRAGAIRRADRAASAMDRIRRIIARDWGHTITSATAEVIRLVEQRKPAAHREACSLIQSLMRWPENKTERDQQRADLGEKVDRADGTMEDPDTGADAGGEESGKPGDLPMEIERLPLCSATDPLRARSGLARSGARFNAPRLPRAIITGSTAGLYKRKRRKRGGSICIDASGSMRMDQSELSELCALAPGATVGYYAGGGAKTPGAYGTLWLYATGGKRADDCPRRGGSNDVDLYAVRWLLRQPAPRVLVSDLCFCGGPIGQAEAALVEVERAIKSRQIIVCETVESARDTFRAMGGKAKTSGAMR